MKTDSANNIDNLILDLIACCESLYNDPDNFTENLDTLIHILQQLEQRDARSSVTILRKLVSGIGRIMTKDFFMALASLFEKMKSNSTASSQKFEQEKNEALKNFKSELRNVREITSHFYLK
ncbi:MAG: hypothetical protein CK424_01485 [Legionella sp.]|nr:MAG: hypothetical protein CK424_01485 [Legionella sp.]